jgi:hypothetical protein
VGCGCEQKQSECSDNVAKCVCDHGMTLSHMCAWYDCTGGEEGMPLRVSMACANAVAEWNSCTTNQNPTDFKLGMGGGRTFQGIRHRYSHHSADKRPRAWRPPARTVVRAGQDASMLEAIGLWVLWHQCAGESRMIAFPQQK